MLRFLGIGMKILGIVFLGKFDDVVLLHIDWAEFHYLPQRIIFIITFFRICHG